jgi:2-polyprenyl-3-methyl-5-hydroxy-6-metoxy-1,4-benzoquinol methylase
MDKYDNYNTDLYSMHMKITKFIQKQKKVLDVGCAYGNLAEVMFTNECEVVGVEIDPEAGKNAQKYCKEVLIGDAELIELSSKYINYFDYIIFADILEHLKNPVKVLKRFKKYLKNEGCIVISLPNITNWRMRLKILFGNFEYENTGVMDSGHIRFFNEKTAKSLLYDSGFEIIKFDLTGLETPIGTSILHKIGRLWPNLLAYQFLIIAKKIN